MPSKTTNRVAACTLAAALTLAALPPAGAAERAPATRAGRQSATLRLSAPGALERAWGRLSAWWGKNGVLIDPDGVRQTDPPPAGSGPTGSSTLAPRTSGGEPPL